MQPSSNKPLVFLLLGAVVMLGWLSQKTNRPAGDPGTCIVGPGSSSEDPASVNMSTVGNLEGVGTGLPRFVEFGSVGCTPCKMMAPILDDLSKTYEGKLTVQFVDVNEDREAGRLNRIRAIPTQVFYDKNGVEFFRHVGFYPEKDILAKFREHGIKLDKESKHE